MKKCKANPLQAGAKVGLITPASPVHSQEEIDCAVALIKGFELVPLLGASAQPGSGYLAGTDLERQADLEKLWSDPSVAAIWALRGGYGCIRILARLNYRLMAEQPKILMGFSDITALEMGIWTHCHLVTFHGPVVTSLQSRFSKQLSLDMLSGRINTTQLPWPVSCRESYLTIRPGRARGLTLGGNLATLLALAGTKYFPNLDGMILFIEEVGEDSYRIDRMLSQLMLMGVLEDTAALIIGKSIPAAPETEADLIEVFRRQLRCLPCPVAYGFPIGHLPEQWTLPQGIMAEVDTENGVFTILENPFETNAACGGVFSPH